MENPEMGRRSFLKGALAMGAVTAMGVEANAESSEAKLEFITQERVEAELQWIKDEHGDKFVNPQADFSEVHFQFDIDRESLDIYFNFDGGSHVVNIPFRYQTPEGKRDTAAVSEGGYMYEAGSISGLSWIYLEQQGLVNPL